MKTNWLDEFCNPSSAYRGERRPQRFHTFAFRAQLEISRSDVKGNLSRISAVGPHCVRSTCVTHWSVASILYLCASRSRRTTLHPQPVP